MKKLAAGIILLASSQMSFAGVTMHCEAVVTESEYLCDLFVSGTNTVVSNVDWFPGGSFRLIGEFGLTAAFGCGGSNSGVANVTYTLNGSPSAASQNLPCSNNGGDPGGGGTGPGCQPNGPGNPNGEICRPPQ